MKDVVQVHDRKFSKIISYETILKKVNEIASAIRKDYQGLDPVFIPVLNGSFMFAADLMRTLEFPCEIEFVDAKSYHGITSSGEVEIETFFRRSKKDRHLIILEDIVDTGMTMEALIRTLEKEAPASIEIATVLTKPDALIADVSVRYTGFEIGNEFVVGYGLDYDGLGRNLPGIYQEV
jgi:hypoxanthine phosphoribosyltransferase